MPRKKRMRKMVAPPEFEGFRPFGHRQGNKKPVELLYEEYEAIKLADYDRLHHGEAAEKMGVSRPTFARIYESARRKIARALVETRHIISVAGNVSFDRAWFLCNGCHARFTMAPELKRRNCPKCQADTVLSIIQTEQLTGYTNT